MTNQGGAPVPNTTSPLPPAPEGFIPDPDCRYLAQNKTFVAELIRVDNMARRVLEELRRKRQERDSIAAS